MTGAATKALLLTGPPGCGKTTLVRRVVERLGGRAGGFYTIELREQGVRVGFEIVTLDGQRAVMSHVRIASPHKVGKYGVDVEAIDRVAVASVRRATRQGLLVVIDEIGKMELCCPAFKEAVMEVLDSGARLLGTIMLAPHPWADALKRDSRVQLVQMTHGNREEALREVVGWRGQAERVQREQPRD